MDKQQERRPRTPGKRDQRGRRWHCGGRPPADEQTAVISAPLEGELTIQLVMRHSELLIAEEASMSDWRRTEPWQEAEARLISFLDSVGATEDTWTVAVRLIPHRISSPEKFAEWLNRKVEKDRTWAIATTVDSERGLLGYALPVAQWRPEEALSFLFVEIHTLLVAWWLTTAWRTRQLVRAAIELAHADDMVSAAACVRPLVETAAAFWVDGHKIISAWDDIKRAGSPQADADAFARRTRMMVALNEVSWGAKFDNRAPRLNEMWGRVQRSNVLGQVEKLAKATAPDFEEDYQWLCNTVHPSLGNTFVFSAPPLAHDTRTHVLTWFAGRPIHIERGTQKYVEQTIQGATTRAATRAMNILRVTMDAALRSVDDVGLTTNAPLVAGEPYWRRLRRPSRNELCPCRSGLKAKRCRHAWGDSAPEFPTDLEL